MRRERGRSRGALPLMAVTVPLLALGVSALRASSADMPALHGALRIDGPDGGDWRPAGGFGLFNRADYLTERALAFLDGAGEREEGEAGRRLLAALTLALGAVKAAPADAHAWTLLGGVAAAAGIDAVARAALAQSRRLAPRTAGVAVERLRLAELEDEGDAAVRAAIRADLALARAARPADLAALLAARPALAARLRRLEGASPTP